MRFGSVALLTLGLVFGIAALRSGSVVHADSGMSQFCTAHDDFGLTHGQCVSLFESSDNSSAGIVTECKVLLVPLGFFRSVGDCVSTLNMFK
jgi:hypothetical protein